MESVRFQPGCENIAISYADRIVTAQHRSKRISQKTGIQKTLSESRFSSMMILVVSFIDMRSRKVLELDSELRIKRS